MTMPSPTDAISTGLRFSLAGASRKVSNDSNGESNSLDSALAAGNKLAEITKHHVEYESSDNQQSNTQNVLKSKYIVLDTKVCFTYFSFKLFCGIHHFHSSQILDTVLYFPCKMLEVISCNVLFLSCS